MPVITEIDDMATAGSLKEDGNKHFKAGEIDQALACYTQALDLNTASPSETAVYHKNRAACYLKMNRNGEAVEDCTKALEISPNDPKALFRRCQAYENMDKHDEAFKDAMHIRQVDPKNTAIQPILLRLHPIMQNKVKELNSTDSKINQMFDLTFGKEESDMEKRKTAANNLIVLAREDSGAEKIFQSGGVDRLVRLFETEKEIDLKVTASRVLACLSKERKERAMAVYKALTLRSICIYMGQNDDNLSAAMANVLQNIINTVLEMDIIKKEREAHEQKRKKEPDSRLRPFPFIYERIGEDGIKLMNEVFPALIKMLSFVKVSSYGRDNAMELIIKYVTRKEGCGWSVKFIDNDGVRNLLEVAGTIPEHRTLKVTQHSRLHASLALSKVYEDLASEKETTIYKDSVNEFFTDLFADDIQESKLEAVMALSALLQGPYDVGSMILSREGVLEMMLAMADSGDAVHAKYAVEALVYSASKKERCSGVIKQATPILKALYQSHNDSIKVRALVGLCKLGSFGGLDASAKTFADGSNTTLAKACRKFLCNIQKDPDLRKWAAEGLSYLTLDADCKEDLVADQEALKSLIDLAKLKDKGTLYPIATIFVNCTNSYDKKEPEPELVEIAKFAKQHVPEEHDKDKEPFIGERVKRLVEAGIVNALVALSETESESSKELLSRVYLSVAKEPEHRGFVVQQGGAKTLIPLSIKGSEKGKMIASHALAKIAITTNPEIAFPGQRSCEVIRPILQLLHQDRTALENFEGLMALTNLASMNDTVRRRVLKEGGVSRIEHYCFEEHDDLRRAATECMCNLVMLEEIGDTYKQENDRLKMMVLFCGEEDERLVLAASGALAMLSGDPEIIVKITQVTEQWHELLSLLAAAPNPALQHRGVFTIKNMIMGDKDTAKKIIESPMMEVLMAVSKLEEPARKAAKDCALEALQQAVEYGFIQTNK